ncbi:VIT1/CCC1 transporter family protein [Marinobacter orientalis]|uniref:VIT family protein n=1 Tax=Marinobacter orientalis TaxID=1928859 RepID=A0A7Y0REY0_9GAMM|nr:VIT family protein [Marinobacter orientalis]NMT64966.1 VIT family protein [Marinobacter orientalis]TGX48141.1 VIT family protein [Marinobacter orientalis]
MSYIDREHHRTQRVGWLRAAVLGANDGLVSVGALVLGVAASQSSPSSVAIAGVSAWIAGALSMAAGEYVSVSSQADTEEADLNMERRALERYPREEHKELARIYERRGLEPELADKVARQLMEHDALGAHARDEIGITDAASARPLQAAGASGLSFTVGVAPPLLAMWLVPGSLIIPVVLAVSLAFLAVLGALAAWTGGAPIVRGTLRVFLWGTLTMVATGAIGAMLGSAG